MRESSPFSLRNSSETASVTQVQSRFNIIREGSIRFIMPAGVCVRMCVCVCVCVCVRVCVRV